MNSLKDTSYLFGANAVFIEELYERYLQDANTVDAAWQEYFRNIEAKQGNFQKPAWVAKNARVIGALSKEELEAPKKKPAADGQSVADVELSLKAANLINAYRTYGHTDVQLDPLGINKPQYHSELDYTYHGITDADLNKEVFISSQFIAKKAKLADLIVFLKNTYSHRVAAEFMHIESHTERKWFEEKLEATAGIVFTTNDEKIGALQDCMEAEMFEHYLHTKYPGVKRFSVEGLENMITATEALIKESVRHGVEEIIIGMAHRGRLNMLTKIMDKPYKAMFSEFNGQLPFPEDMGIPGDVKYHLGASSDRNIEGKNVHLSLCPNPSHLEVVNSVVLGKVRAKQDLRGDEARSCVMGLLYHGDAAFAGQGSVMESLSLSQLPGFYTGGTIHVVTNNQIGFTTNPTDSRSTSYCTDIAKFIGAPIFHVNGDDAEAVLFVTKLACEYRHKFKRDVVLDIVGYRKYGHNEGDEPMFTQPTMYNVIKAKKTPPDVYFESLKTQGVLVEADYARMKAEFKAKLDNAFEEAKVYKTDKPDWLEGNWKTLKAAEITRQEPVTGVDIKKLKALGEVLYKVPSDFNINLKVARLLETKEEMFKSGENLDWAMGEALAFATLLDEGFKIRMSGQDVERGTFSHRHAVWTDQVSESKYTPLNNIPGQKGKLEIRNSDLSEFGVTAFEYGYSFTDPNALTIWEAQYGDFANGAQVTVDQYISSGEAKWLRMSGLVMLLPHGYEGQGPEHTSARLERYLQLCSNDNMQVVNCTTPASIYHALRRQLHRDFRKPLIVMSPKSMLRNKAAVSKLEEFAAGTAFKPVIEEVENLDAAKVKKVMLCSGKVYYDLLEQRKALGRNDIAIIRLEQLYPFPAESLGVELKKYTNAEILWCQEEHENMGSFYFVEPRIERLLMNIKHKYLRARFVGRARSSSPSAGYMRLHQKEQKKFLEDAFAN